VAGLHDARMLVRDQQVDQAVDLAFGRKVINSVGLGDGLERVTDDLPRSGNDHRRLPADYGLPVGG
jgi:hypothetical protein